MTEPPDDRAEAPPASEAPAVIHLPPPADLVPPPPKTRRRNGTTRRGRHFGPRPVDDPLDAWLPATRCTTAQRKQADALAAAEGISLNGLVRARMFGTAGPRVHRNPTALVKAAAQLVAQMGKGGSNLNQGVRALNRIAIAADDGAGCDRLADLIEEMAELHR
jgi:hypothetical protein